MLGPPVSKDKFLSTIQQLTPGKCIFINEDQVERFFKVKISDQNLEKIVTKFAHEHNVQVRPHWNVSALEFFIPTESKV